MNKETQKTTAKAEDTNIKKRRTLTPDLGEERYRGVDLSNQAIFETVRSFKNDELSVDEYWERIFFIHLKTKELYILAEEYGSELKTFYLPVNSLNGAYENVIHVCAADYMSRKDGEKANESYVKENLRKALDLECKAFFDTADFLSILLRKKISDCLSGFSYPQIASVWDEYNDVRTAIIETNREIAEIRTKKTEMNDYYIDAEVEKYYIKTKKLLEWYIYMEEKVYPRLEQRFGDI